MPDDFITTLDSDDEETYNGESSKTARTPINQDDLDPNFDFDLSAGGIISDAHAWGGDELLGASTSAQVSQT